MTFRKDINGLRAIAVLAVVLFHFRVAGFSGGFSGVDIFFVISGYLMTGIIFSKINKTQFSIIDFYLHRARRIIPALAALCIFMIIFGFLYFLTSEYRETMRNIKSVIQFTSNLKFYDSFGYFDAPSQENWLLHTWSLSVEWQFYIIYPLLIVILRKLLTLQTTKLVVILAAILSLAWSIIYTPLDPSAAFYFLPTRAWEMLAGGIVFLFPLQLPTIAQKIMEWLGLVLIVLGILLLNEHLLWPSYLAIIPVLGTMLIIWSNQQSFITNNLLFQWLGKISYSVYLWHWPIVVLLLTSGLATNPLYIIIGIIASLLLGNLSYLLIEKRVMLKYSRPVEIIKYILIVIVITAIAAALASAVKKHPQIRKNWLISDTFEELDYLTEKRHAHSAECMLMDDKKVLPECKIGDNPLSIIVFGDSHADVSFSAIQQANDKGSSILWAHMGCPILDNVKFNISRRDGCVHLIKDKMALLDSSYPNVPVLLINRLFNTLGNELIPPQIYFDKPALQANKELEEQFRSAYLRTVCTIAKNRPVYILKPIPEPGFHVPKQLSRNLLLGLPLATQSTSEENYHQLNSFILSIMEEAHQQCGAILLDPAPYLCANGQCITSKEGKPLYFDDNHLTEYGNKLLVPLFKTIFNH